MGPACCLLKVMSSSSPCCAQRNRGVSLGSLPHTGRGHLGIFSITSGHHNWLSGSRIGKLVQRLVWVQAGAQSKEALLFGG